MFAIYELGYSPKGLISSWKLLLSFVVSIETMEKHFTPFIFLINGLVVMQESHEIFTKHSLMWFHDNILKKMFLCEDQISSDRKSNMNHRLTKYLQHSYLKFQFVFISTCRDRATYFSVCFKFFLWLHQIQKSISYLAYKSLLKIFHMEFH